LTIEVYYNY